jgi:hypothetical protein
MDRTMRRIRERYEKFGYTGLFDQRKGKRSTHRVPMETALRDEHQIVLSCTWVEQALRGQVWWRSGASAGHTAEDGRAETAAGYAAAHRREQTPVAERRPLVRPDRDSGRCHQRDLPRATGGGSVDADGDGGATRSDRDPRSVLRSIERPGQSFLRDGEGRRKSWESR